MVQHVLALIVVFTIATCQSPSLEPRLTATEATRIAEAKARGFRPDLRDYHHATAHYDATDDSWWIPYLLKGAADADFVVQVEDKTSNAWVVLP